jgi:putative DNA primase/helicase
VDLPNNNHSKALLRVALHALAKQFDGPDGTVGVECHDARRIAKLPGTWARRGPHSPERPHRLCRLVYVPEAVEVVPDDAIRALGRPDAEPTPGEANGNGHADRFKVRVPHRTADAYGRSALDQECGKVALASKGKRNETLNIAAFSLGQLVAGGVLKREAVEAALEQVARRCGLDLDPGCGEEGVRKTIASGLDAGATEPRGVPERNGHAGANGHAPAPTWKEGESIIVRASAITPRKVEWLWPGRIPLGKLTTFAGVGGLGKTFVLCDITARVTQGSDWPDAEGECCERGQVLFVSGEDDPDDTLVPRLIELGADLERVVFLKTEVQDYFSLADIKTLDEAIRQAGPGVRFVAIDPPTAFLGGVDDHKNSELRGLLSPLKSWAAKHRVAVVFNTHVNKPQGAKVEAMMRVMGSVAWVNAVRAAHMFARDPEDPERRLCVPMKLNIGKEKKGLAYRIVEAGELARVEWLGSVDTTADEAVNKERRQGREVEAGEFLRDLFAKEDEVASKLIFAAAKEAKISDNALREAKQALRIEARKKVVAGQGVWVWIWTQARETEDPPPAGAADTVEDDDGGTEF